MSVMTLRSAAPVEATTWASDPSLVSLSRNKTNQNSEGVPS